MPKFTCVFKDSGGKTYTEEIEAYSQEIVVEKYQNQNYFIVSIKQLGESEKSKQNKAKKKLSRKFTHKKVRLQDLLTFAHQLATMVEAGVNLVRCLDIILTSISSEALFYILSEVKKDVEGGDSLSHALSKHPKVFNQFWVSLLEVGEASGNIGTILKKLAFYLEQEAAFRSTVASGLIYPSILCVVCMGAVAFFALFVGPRFEDIFESMNAQLPLITTVLMDSFRFIRSNFLIILGCFVFIIFVLRKYTQTYQGKLYFEKFLYSLPVIGEVSLNIIVERFSSQMALLIDAGVPILYALEISEKLVNNNTCALVINNMKEGVRKGEMLVTPMEKSVFFPDMAVQLVMVGEETGELSKMLQHVADFYQNLVEVFMKRFATIIEPVMIIVMGAVIGTIVIAMFLPLFNLSQI